MHYELYYWTGIGAVANSSGWRWKMPARPTPTWRVHGDKVMQPFPTARPRVASIRAAVHGQWSPVIAQVAAILDHLGPELGLVPEAASRRVQALQLQLTIADRRGGPRHTPSDCGLDVLRRPEEGSQGARRCDAQRAAAEVSGLA